MFVYHAFTPHFPTIFPINSKGQFYVPLDKEGLSVFRLKLIKLLLNAKLVESKSKAIPLAGDLLEVFIELQRLRISPNTIESVTEGQIQWEDDLDLKGINFQSKVSIAGNSIYNLIIKCNRHAATFLKVIRLLKACSTSQNGVNIARFLYKLGDEIGYIEPILDGLVALKMAGASIEKEEEKELFFGLLKKPQFAKQITKTFHKLYALGILLGPDSGSNHVYYFHAIFNIWMDKQEKLLALFEALHFDLLDVDVLQLYQETVCTIPFYQDIDVVSTMYEKLVELGATPKKDLPLFIDCTKLSNLDTSNKIEALQEIGATLKEDYELFNSVIQDNPCEIVSKLSTRFDILRNQGLILSKNKLLFHLSLFYDHPTKIIEAFQSEIVKKLFPTVSNGTFSNNNNFNFDDFHAVLDSVIYTPQKALKAFKILDGIPLDLSTAQTIYLALVKGELRSEIDVYHTRVSEMISLFTELGLSIAENVALLKALVERISKGHKDFEEARHNFKQGVHVVRDVFGIQTINQHLNLALIESGSFIEAIPEVFSYLKGLGFSPNTDEDLYLAAIKNISRNECQYLSLLKKSFTALHRLQDEIQIDTQTLKFIRLSLTLKPDFWFVCLKLATILDIEQIDKNLVEQWARYQSDINALFELLSKYNINHQKERIFLNALKKPEQIEAFRSRVELLLKRGIKPHLQPHFFVYAWLYHARSEDLYAAFQQFDKLTMKNELDEQEKSDLLLLTIQNPDLIDTLYKGFIILHEVGAAPWTHSELYLRILECKFHGAADILVTIYQMLNDLGISVDEDESYRLALDSAKFLEDETSFWDSFFLSLYTLKQCTDGLEERQILLQILFKHPAYAFQLIHHYAFFKEELDMTVDAFIKYVPIVLYREAIFSEISTLTEKHGMPNVLLKELVEYLSLYRGSDEDFINALYELSSSIASGAYQESQYFGRFLQCLNKETNQLYKVEKISASPIFFETKQSLSKEPHSDLTTQTESLINDTALTRTA